MRKKRVKRVEQLSEASESRGSVSQSFVLADRSGSVLAEPSDKDISKESYLRPHRTQRPDTRQESRLQDTSVQRPSSRHGTPVKREKQSSSPIHRNEKRRRDDIYLPELVLPNKHRDTVDILKGWCQDGMLSEPQYIRQTRSGIAYQVLIRPPRRLPRIVSDGSLESSRVSNPAPYLAQPNTIVPPPILSQGLGFKKIPKCHSGERFAETMRYSAELNRLKREKKNIDKNRQKLLLHEGRSSRLSETYDTTAARVQEVRAKQDAIREHEKIKMMENFIKQRRNH